MATLRERKIKSKRDPVIDVIIRMRGERIVRTFDTRAQAKEWAQKTEVEIRAGSFKKNKKADQMTLKEAFEKYLEEVSKKKRSKQPLTRKREADRIRAWERHPLSRRRLQDIETTDITAYVVEREKEGVSSSTIRQEIALIRHLYSIARGKWNLRVHQPVIRHVAPVQDDNARDRRLSRLEHEYLKRVASPELMQIVDFAIETAMRQGEIAGMTWRALDLKKQIVALKETKSGKPRYVPLSARATEILKALPRPMDPDTFVWKYQSRGQSFTYQAGQISRHFAQTVMAARDLYEKECLEYKRRTDKTFLFDLRFHDLRHEATSRLFELGLSTEKVKGITGHKTYHMLARYTHLVAEETGEELREREQLRKENDSRRR